jgi:caffeoyl-CoA O-methyltransferase
MDFLDPEIDQYAQNHSQEEPELLQKLNRETWTKVLQPRMLSGHLQGRTLSFLSKLIQPKAILEIGTYTGYSALCLAEGLAEGGELHTIDINEELEPMIRRYFAATDHVEKLHLHIGNALEIIPSLQKTWDLVFIDADKENYSGYFNLVVEKVRKGGLMIADNVLWSGKVLHEADPKDEETKALQNFNEMVANDPRVEALLLPIRDGLMLLRKV